MLRMGPPWMRSKTWWMQERYCTALLLISYIIAIQYHLCLQNGELEILSFAQYQRQPESESHAGVDMGEYEHAMDTIHASVQGSPVALLRSEDSRCAVGWLVVCTVGCWTVESGARRRRMDFLTVLSNHLQKRAGPLSFCPGAYSELHTQAGGGKPQTHSPPAQNTYTLSLSPCSILSQKVWSVSIVTPLHSPFIVSDQRC